MTGRLVEPIRTTPTTLTDLGFVTRVAGMYKRTTRKRPVHERFWEKVDKSGGPDACWLWIGGRDKDGYGRMGSGERGVGHLIATHVALQLHGVDVPLGMRVCHRCDNPPCVNPAHLFVGSARDNSRDMVAKDRHCHGERYPGHKLSPSDVVALRAARASGVTYQELERRFGISRSVAHRIVTGRRWSHVGGTVQSEVRHSRRATDAEVLDLRNRYAAGESQSALAAHFGLSLAAVCNIVNGHSRRSAPGPTFAPHTRPATHAEMA